MAQKGSRNKCKIDVVQITSDILTSRGGLTIFVRYLRNILIFPHLERLFGGIRKNGKGQPAAEIFKQLFSFFLDGTSRHLAYFDTLRDDPGYGGSIETGNEALLSCAAVKRFFNAFSWYRIWLFRRLLQQLFLWRLKISQPRLIELGIDTMVMDNNEAKKRHGVEPTYKKVKGFQPLQMTWGRFIIDAVFRGGSKHSNHGDTVEKMVRHIVAKIRKSYREDALILLRMDAGFFDEKLFKVFEELGVGYVCTGKLYGDVKTYVSATEKVHWKRYIKAKRAWDYLEFGSRRESWVAFRKAIFCRPMDSNGQLLLEFARPETILYTNLGMSSKVDEKFLKAGLGDRLTTESVIETAHGRGADELIHRALKEFGAETLPFKKFSCNAAFYYTLLVAFFLYESFKEDVCGEVVPIESYPTTLRRKLIDIAGKIVRTGGRLILKITETVWNGLRFDELWNKSAHPHIFCWV